MSGGNARAVVGDLEHGVAVPARDGHLDLASRRACGGAPLSSRLSDHPVELVGIAPRHRAVARRSSADGRPRPAGPRRRLPRRSRRGRTRAARRSGRRRRGPAAAGRRRAGSSAARSAAPSRPSRSSSASALRASSAPGAARGWRGCWSAACAARARRRRRTRAGAASSARSRTRAASSARSIWSSVRASSPTSSSRLRLGDSVGGVARGRRSRGPCASARRSGAWRGRRSRCRRGRRAAVPPRTPGGEEQPQAIDRGVDVLHAAGVLDEQRRPKSARPECRADATARLPDFTTDWVSGAPRCGAFGVLRSRHRAVRVDDLDGAVASGASRCGVAELRVPSAWILECVVSAAVDRGAAERRWLKSACSRFAVSRPTTSGEDDQDHERQDRRDGGEAPADRPALRRQRRAESLKPLHRGAL